MNRKDRAEGWESLCVWKERAPGRVLGMGLGPPAGLLNWWPKGVSVLSFLRRPTGEWEGAWAAGQKSLSLIAARPPVVLRLGQSPTL